MLALSSAVAESTAAQTPSRSVEKQTTEFCLEGQFDLGARHQGSSPGRVEFTERTWCVTTEDDGQRVLFEATGKANPDMDDSFAVAFLPPDLVRIVNRESPPDVEFQGTASLDDALRHRRIDPRRLLEELENEAPRDLEATIEDGRVSTVRSTADLPLRGRVPVVWSWRWQQPDRPSVTLEIDGDTVFNGQGRWRTLESAEAARAWQRTPGTEPIQVPGDRWPTRIRMQNIQVADGVSLIRGVRTGFQHLVVETREGLVVVDAPAGWVQVHQIPATDMVPGLGISGLSEQFIDFLGQEFPDQPLRAVVLTHAHDDHAGGARAFAAAGATVFAPEAYVQFLQSALNAETMPRDRMSELGGKVGVQGVSGTLRLEDPRVPVELRPIESSPHTVASLGVSLPKHDLFFVSDLHVPRSENTAPDPSRAVAECWFANWAIENLGSDVKILNSHSPIETPLRRLHDYVQSEVCH